MAIVGVVLGHWLAYVLAVPDPHVRTEVLAASGHSYWLLAIKAAVVLGLTSLGTILLRYLLGRVRGDRPADDRLVSVVLRLSFLQVLAFAAMEVTERVAAGAPVGEMFQHHIFLLGLAVQLLISCAGAFVLLWFARAAKRICDALLPTASAPAPALLAPRAVRHSLRPLSPLCGATGLRGPPRH